MKVNVGGADRAIRIVLGFALLMLAVAGELGLWAGWAGLIVMATGVLRYCGAYSLLKVNTCAMDRGR
jgi:predicted lysophospholipase L1 biosynthesis ABC-type transport system permease subunit